MAYNINAWIREKSIWPDQDNYDLDGYTLLVSLNLRDSIGVNFCIQMGDANYSKDKSNSYTCFAIKYNTDYSPHIVQAFTNTLKTTVTYVDDSTGSAQSPTFAITNTYYESECGDNFGVSYTGGGVDNCWGISPGTADSDDFVPVLGYLFLPK